MHARRNALIVRLRAKGLTLEAIGGRVHLTDERVRQILNLAPGAAVMFSRMTAQHEQRRMIKGAGPVEKTE